MSEERPAVPAPSPMDSGSNGAPFGATGGEVATATTPLPRDVHHSSMPPSIPPRDQAPGRRRLSLRIPDDEVVRPSESVPNERPAQADRSALPPRPSVPPLEPGFPLVAVTPMRIISINAEPAALAKGRSVPPSPPRPTAPQEPVTEPTLVPRIGPSSADSDPVLDGLAMTPRAVGPLEADEVEVRFEDDAALGVRPTPISVDIRFEEEGLKTPPSTVVSPFEDDALQKTPLLALEVRFDDDAPIETPNVAELERAREAASRTLPSDTPVASYEDGAVKSTLAGVARDRRSDPPPEVAAEDVFAVEATDERAADPDAPMRPRAPSQPPAVQPPLPRPRKRAAAAVTRAPLVIVPPHVGSIPPQPSEGPGGRRKGRFWWEELFNDDYVRTTEKVSEEYIGREIRFIEESLGVERGGAILDLACGAGRHAVELARQGYEVVGFDLSLSMLARAGDEAQDRQAKLNFVQGDMREMAFDEQFDGVYCWNTSFGYFEEDKNAQVVDRVHRALRGGGLFLLDVINRDFLVRHSPSLAWFEGDGCVCMDEMSVDFITSRMKVKRTLMLDDGRSREIEYSIRIYSLSELGKILHEHGFIVREVSGGLAVPGVFFGNESPRVIVLAEKR